MSIEGIGKKPTSFLEEIKAGFSEASDLASRVCLSVKNFFISCCLFCFGPSKQLAMNEKRIETLASLEDYLQRFIYYFSLGNPRFHVQLQANTPSLGEMLGRIGELKSSFERSSEEIRNDYFFIFRSFPSLKSCNAEYEAVLKGFSSLQKDFIEENKEPLKEVVESWNTLFLFFQAKTDEGIKALVSVRNMAKANYPIVRGYLERLREPSIVSSDSEKAIEFRNAILSVLLRSAETTDSLFRLILSSLTPNSIGFTPHGRCCSTLSPFFPWE